MDKITYKGKTIRDWVDLLTNPKTNGDNLRTWPDEELAELIADGSCRNIGCPAEFVMADGLDCRGCWLQWLKRPADGGNEDA